MDNKNQQPVYPDQPAAPRPVVLPTQEITRTAQEDKPKLIVSDGEAQALLALNNLRAGQGPKAKLPPTRFLIIIALAILTSFAIGAVKTGSNSKSSSSGSNLGIPNQAVPTNGRDNVTNQINKDVNSCANPLTAMSYC